METILAILFFCLGASIGSFLSVVIYRLHSKQKGIFLGHSFCPNCKKRLTASEMIPLFSYIINKGKCRHCHLPVSSHYLLLEIASGLVFLVLYFRFPFIFFNAESAVINWPGALSLLLNIIYSSLLMGIFFFDLKYQKIPDLMLFPFMAIALIGGLILGKPDFISMIIAIVIAIVIFGGQILLSKGKWLGEGDLYLTVGMGLMLGYQKFLLAVAVSYLIGALISIVLLIKKEAKMKSHIPFAPFLVLGTFFALFFGEEFISWYLNYLYI